MTMGRQLQNDEAMAKGKPRCGKCRSIGIYPDRDLLTGAQSIACRICGNRYPGGPAPILPGQEPETATIKEKATRLLAFLRRFKRFVLVEGYIDEVQAAPLVKYRERFVPPTEDLKATTDKQRNKVKKGGRHESKKRGNDG